MEKNQDPKKLLHELRFKNKYRITSARADWWDYSWAGAYFITICTANRYHYFGEIENGKMKLSQVGVLADVFWHEIKHHAKNVELGAFVVMPNHIHGILILKAENGTRKNHNPKDLNGKTIAQARFQNQGKNTVSSIIGSYKSIVTRSARRLGFEFDWQSLFWDNIIKNDEQYRYIHHYIEHNPQKWKEDMFSKMVK